MYNYTSFDCCVDNIKFPLQRLFWAVVKQAYKDKDVKFYNSLDWLGEYFFIDDDILIRLKILYYKQIVT